MRLPGWLGHPYTHAAGALLSLLAALAVVAFMVGTLEYTKLRGRLLFTTLMIAGFFATMLVATATPRQGAMRWGFTVILAWATLALLLLVLGLWATPDSDAYWKSAAAVTFLAFGMSLAGLALGLKSGASPARFLAWMSAGLASLLTAMTVIGLAAGVSDAPYWLAFALLALCWVATLVALVALRLFRRRDPDR